MTFAIEITKDNGAVMLIANEIRGDRITHVLTAYFGARPRPAGHFRVNVLEERG